MEDQPIARTERTLIACLHAWIVGFEPAGRTFADFERDKIQRNAELIALLGSQQCSDELLREYVRELTLADELGYFPFNLGSGNGVILTGQDFILKSDRDRSRSHVTQGRTCDP